MSVKIPFRATVASIVKSRYAETLPEDASRPMEWSDRKEGIDIITTDAGETLRLSSDGQQSVPQKGWVILITSGDSAAGFRWTLFGMPKGCEVHTY